MIIKPFHSLIPALLALCLITPPCILCSSISHWSTISVNLKHHVILYPCICICCSSAWNTLITILTSSSHCQILARFSSPSTTVTCTLKPPRPLPAPAFPVWMTCPLFCDLVDVLSSHLSYYMYHSLLYFIVTPCCELHMNKADS